MSIATTHKGEERARRTSRVTHLPNFGDLAEVYFTLGVWR
jgi:hypothetical protein